MIESDCPLKNQLLLKSLASILIGATLVVLTSCSNETPTPSSNVTSASFALGEGVCTGDISESCTVYGATETACNNLTDIDCQWSNGACVPETNCNGYFDETNCATRATSISACIWGPRCNGDLSAVCTQLGTTAEECANITSTTCAWIDDTCSATSSCTELDRTQCLAVKASTAPIETCVWTEDPPASIPGTCVGDAYSGGEGQCIQRLTQEICETLELRDGSNRLLFTASNCAWNGTSCHVKSTVCTDQTNQNLCLYLTPPYYGYGECTWVLD